jgi:ribosome-associated protein
MSETIKLDQFLKFMGEVSTGGQAKILIKYGDVEVNGEVETRRGRKLVTGDQVLVNGKTLTVNLYSREHRTSPPSPPCRGARGGGNTGGKDFTI